MLLHYTNKNSYKPSHMPGCKSYAHGAKHNMYYSLMAVTSWKKLTLPLVCLLQPSQTGR